MIRLAALFTVAALGWAGAAMAQDADIEPAIQQARAILWSGDGPGAEAAFLDIRRRLDVQGLDGGVDAARVTIGLGSARCFQGDCAGGVASMRAAHARLAAMAGPDDVETLIAAATLVDVLRMADQPGEALTLARTEGERARTALGTDHVTTLWLRASQAYALDDLGREAEAEPILLEVIASWTASGWGDTAATRDARLFHAGLLQQLNREGEAEPVLRAMLALPDLAPEQASRAWTILGTALHGTGRFDEAVAAARMSVETTTLALGPDHRETLRARANLGVVLGEVGDDEEALALLRDSADRATALLGPRDVQTGTAVYNLAALLHSTGRAAQAVPLFRLAADSRDPELARRARHHLGLTLSALGRNQEAVLEAEAAIALYPADSDSRMLAVSLVSLGAIYNELGRSVEALLVLERALAMAERTDADWSIFSGAWLSLGEAQVGAGMMADAEISLGRAKALADAHLSPGHPRRVYRDERLAQLLIDQSRPGEALALLRSDTLPVIARMGGDQTSGFDAYGSNRALFARIVQAGWEQATTGGSAR